MGYPSGFVSDLSILHKKNAGCVCAGVCVCTCARRFVQVHHFSQDLSHGTYVLDDAGCFPVTGLRPDDRLSTKSFGLPRWLRW